MRVLTEIDERILRHLAHYKFLTLSLLVKLKTGEKSYVSSRLKLLRDDGFVGVSQYGGIYKAGQGGKVENINYLLPKGVRLLVENCTDLPIEKIQYPKNIDGMFRNDYLHRISTLNAQVSYELWAKQQDYTPLFFHTYFHKSGSSKGKDDNPLKSITRITFDDGSFVEPDVILAYETPDEIRKLLVIEVSNGKDTTRIVEQLKTLCDAVFRGLITAMFQDTYEIKHSPRILCTVETEDMLRLVLKRMNSDPYFTPDWVEKLFFFQVAGKVLQEFGNGWVNLKNEKIVL